MQCGSLQQCSRGAKQLAHLASAHHQPQHICATAASRWRHTVTTPRPAPSSYQTCRTVPWRDLNHGFGAFRPWSGTLRGAATAASASAAGARVSTTLPEELVIQLPKECEVPAPTLPALHQVLQIYAARTPRLAAIVDHVMRPAWPDVPQLGHDHFAFRTFGVPGLGISSLERLLLPLGYSRAPQQPPLAFPGKKLLAAWFRATDPRVRAVLPRIFVSEIQVEQLSEGAQQLIRGCTSWAAEEQSEQVTVKVLAALLTGTAPWPRPSLQQYDTLLQESEYAAWVLAHGYSLNHTALALHRLPPAGRGGDIAALVGRLQAAGLELNPEGGLVKVSPDGLLLQSAVLADRVPFTFACGEQRDIAGAYVEFVQRLRLPEFKDLPDGEVREEHLRDGFEVGNADRIFESTTLAAASRG